MVAIIILKELMKKSQGERNQGKWMKVKGTENRSGFLEEKTDVSGGGKT